jgi:hypothetical protein
MTELTRLWLRKYAKYAGCVRSFHALFFIYTHPGLCCLYFICGTEENELTGKIPTELQTIPLSFCQLGECRAFWLPPIIPPCITLVSHTLAIVIIHIVGGNCFDSVAGINNCDTSNNRAVLSDIPSEAPSRSDVPSYIPSAVPSVVPSGSPTSSNTFPSETPSRSDVPSYIPSAVPSVVPSGSPTSSNTFPSETPSRSDVPSYIPSVGFS